MSIPYDLQQLLDQAFILVQHHVDHELSLGYRQEIYKALGPYHNSNDPMSDDSGHQRRLTLAIQSVQYVLPVWKRAWPMDDTPGAILALAKKVAINEVDRISVVEDINRYHHYIDELIASTNNIAGSVGIAAIKTLSLALWDDAIHADDIDYTITDSQEFTINDAHFHAAVAYANGPTWAIRAAPDSDPHKRREFWEWWIKEAVPRAWNLQQIIG